MKLYLSLLCLALGACATAGKGGSEASVAVYDLGAAPLRNAGPALPMALEMRTPYENDSRSIDYRLAYSEPLRLRAYAQARWAAAPAILVRQRLAQRLDLIVRGLGGVKCLLRVDLDEFSQVFASPNSSRVLVQARATMLDSTRKVLAERTLRVEKPAASPDSRGGVAALAEAVDQLADELGAWRGELVASGRIKACQ